MRCAIEGHTDCASARRSGSRLSVSPAAVAIVPSTNTSGASVYESTVSPRAR